LRTPVSSITSAPPACGLVSGSARNNAIRRLATASASQSASLRKNGTCCTGAVCAWAMGSAPTRAVSVLLRSRGSKKPAR